MCDDHSTHGICTCEIRLITGGIDVITNPECSIHGGKNGGFCVDGCIAPLVQAVNDAGFRTVASCCGHGHRPGNIALADGRELIIAPDYDTARQIEDQFPVTSYGETREGGGPLTPIELLKEIHANPLTRAGRYTILNGAQLVDWLQERLEAEQARGEESH